MKRLVALVMIFAFGVGVAASACCMEEGDSSHSVMQMDTQAHLDHTAGATTDKAPDSQTSDNVCHVVCHSASLALVIDVDAPNAVASMSAGAVLGRSQFVASGYAAVPDQPPRIS